MVNRKGFTLIELLVVIAIIAILAALLFPVFSNAKKKAQYATCSHNTSQWLRAMHMYMNDWSDYFPLCGANKRFMHNNPSDKVMPVRPPFYEVVKKYTAAGEAAKWCPAMVLVHCGGSYAYAEKYYGWSYWFQCEWSWAPSFARRNEKANLCGIPSSEVKYPSKTPAIGDTNRCHDCNKNGSVSGAYMYPIGYVDGHVQDVVMREEDENKFWYTGRDGSAPKLR